jgi:hypothetical protein
MSYLTNPYMVSSAATQIESIGQKFWGDESADEAIGLIYTHNGSEFVFQARTACFTPTSDTSDWQDWDLTTPLTVTEDTTFFIGFLSFKATGSVQGYSSTASGYAGCFFRCTDRDYGGACANVPSLANPTMTYGPTTSGCTPAIYPAAGYRFAWRFKTNTDGGTYQEIDGLTNTTETAHGYNIESVCVSPLTFVMPT